MEEPGHDRIVEQDVVGVLTRTVESGYDCRVVDVNVSVLERYGRVEFIGVVTVTRDGTRAVALHVDGVYVSQSATVMVRNVTCGTARVTTGGDLDDLLG